MISEFQFHFGTWFHTYNNFQHFCTTFFFTNYSQCFGRLVFFSCNIYVKYCSEWISLNFRTNHCISQKNLQSQTHHLVNVFNKKTTEWATSAAEYFQKLNVRIRVNGGSIYTHTKSIDPSIGACLVASSWVHFKRIYQCKHLYKIQCFHLQLALIMMVHMS